MSQLEFAYYLYLGLYYHLGILDFIMKSAFCIYKQGTRGSCLFLALLAP